MLARKVWNCVALGCFVVACCGQSALAQDANMEKAMTAAFGSKEIKKLKVKGHEFNIKPIKTESTSGGGVKVSGQISHHLRMRDDDQVYYSFTLRADGALDAFDVTVEKSLMNRALGFAFDLLKKQLVGSSATSSVEQGIVLSNELQSLEAAIKLAESKIGTGGWEKASAAIIANVMIRAKTTTSARGTRVYDRVNHLRRAVERASSRPATPSAPVVVRPTGGTFNSQVLQPQVRDHRNR